MKKGIAAVLATGALLLFALPVFAQNLMGTGTDANATWLGDIKYLFNPSGYQFWFTPTESHGYYTAGHSYHNVYKYDLEDSTDWCGPVTIPNREPYNEGGTAGMTAYYKIWDVTAGVYACGTE